MAEFALKRKVREGSKVRATPHRYKKGRLLYLGLMTSSLCIDDFASLFCRTQTWRDHAVTLNRRLVRVHACVG